MKKISFMLIFFFTAVNAFALAPETHEDLNFRIIDKHQKANEYLLNNLSIKNGVSQSFEFAGQLKSAREWIAYGGIKEDVTGIKYTRSLNHFHNPLVQNWQDAGFQGKMSSAVWAQLENQSSLLGNYSWPDTRNYFFNALTMETEIQRQANYANCFRALGQVMHIIEDASVPAHARNDFHYFPMYEDWLEELRTGTTDDRATYEGIVNITIPASNPFLTSRVGYNPDAHIPIAGFFDTDIYNGANPDATLSSTIGMAEYTNANFFSEDTIFKKYPYPGKTSFVPVDNYIADPRYPNDPTKQVLRKYYFKTGDGDSGYLLAAINYLPNYAIEYVPWLDFNSIDNTEWGTLDRLCYYEYARKLIPRAISYSSALLDYFFRGQIDAVDAKATKDESGNIKGVTLKVKNATPGETMFMVNGSSPTSFLVVSYSYKKPDGTKVYGKSGEVHLTSNISSGNDTSSDTYKYTFTFSAPIPADAKEEQYMLVYRGKLGQEEDTVAGKKLKVDVVMIDDWERNDVLWVSKDSRGELSI